MIAPVVVVARLGSIYRGVDAHVAEDGASDLLVGGQEISAMREHQPVLVRVAGKVGEDGVTVDAHSLRLTVHTAEASLHAVVPLIVGVLDKGEPLAFPGKVTQVQSILGFADSVWLVPARAELRVEVEIGRLADVARVRDVV